MKRFSITLFLFCSTVFAQDFCELAVNKPIKSVMLPGAPSWFISANPDGKSVGVIMNGENRMFSMDEVDENGEPKMINVPGDVDPVYSPDSWFFTSPGKFYDAEVIPEMLSNEENAESLERLGDTSLHSVYQSIGVLKTDSKTKAEYIYIADPNSVQDNIFGYLEYSIMSATRNPTTKEKTLKEVDKGILCKGFVGHTPMISSDGKYLSIINDETMTTQILKVDTSKGTCSLMVDLGVPTGKVSFNMSEDPRKITFHVDKHNTTIDWFEGIPYNMSKDTYVMDFDVQNDGTKDEKWDIASLQRISNNNETGTGVYYPRFTRDGDIIAIKNAGDNYYLEKYDLSNGTDASFDRNLLYPVSKEVYSCESPEFQKFAAVYGLASIYAEICEDNQNSIREKDAVLTVLAMDKDNCESLVNKYFESGSGKIDSSKVKNLSENKRRSIESITKEEMLGVCPESKAKDKDVDTLVVSNTVVADTPENAFRRNCSGCHLPDETSGGYSFLTDDGSINNGSGSVNGLNANSAWKSVNLMLNNDSINQMPPNGHQMSEKDLRNTVEYLKSQLSDNAQIKAVEKLLGKKIRDEY